MDISNSLSALDACDAMFAAGDPTATDLIHARRALKQASALLQTKYDELAAKRDDASLSDDDRDLHELELLDAEEKLIPFSARLERIKLLLTSIKEDRTRALSLARTTADYSDPGRIDAERVKLIEDAAALATRISNGLQPTAAWQTQRKYAAIRPVFEDIRRTTDREKTLELAAQLINTLRPELLAKVSAHATVKAELLDAFVTAITKS